MRSRIVARSAHEIALRYFRRDVTGATGITRRLPNVRGCGHDGCSVVCQMPKRSPKSRWAASMISGHFVPS